MAAYSAEQVNELLQCPVCLDRLKAPKILPCQHTFCLEPCLVNLAGGRGRKLKCPQCRESHKLPSGGVSSLPNNRLVMGLLDLTPTHTATGDTGDDDDNEDDLINLPPPQETSQNLDLTAGHSFCDNCEESQPSNLLSLCYHCHDVICPACHRQHLSHVKSETSRLVNATRQSILGVAEAVNNVEQRTLKLRDNFTSVKQDISTVFDAFVQQLRQREASLISELERFYISELRGLNTLQENLEVEMARIASHCDLTEAEVHSSNTDTEDLMAMMAQCRDHNEIAKRVFESTRAIPTASKVIRFTTTNTNSLKSHITRFGELGSNDWYSGLLQRRNLATAHQENDAPSRTELNRTLPPLRQSSGWAQSIRRNPLTGTYQSPSQTLPTPRRYRTYDREARELNVFERNQSDLGNSARDNNLNQSNVVNSSGPRVSYPPSVQFEMILDSQINDGEPSVIVFQRGTRIRKIGCRGSEPGRFSSPRGVAVSGNNIFVADSSNNRVQLFELGGRFLSEFGCYGTGDGEFDCLTGVAVDSTGRIIISDRHNHRIQIFNSSGEFACKFGTEGTEHGNFSSPWGIAVDSADNIYICDKDNNRIQVFQPDNTFLMQIGQLGSSHGELQCPHYAIVHSNRLYVSDSGNHRVQVFTTSGDYLLVFGREGSGNGHFKYPRGISISEQGNIIVGDSGNNRLEFFSDTGSLITSYGTWGTESGQFKGIEGIAVAEGMIITCDRENHRLQIL